MPLTTYILDSIFAMKWTVRLAVEFLEEFRSLPATVQTEPLAHARLIERFGPNLGRPRVDTLKGSRYRNMKELRFDAGTGVWRVAFAFDPRREAVLLVAGDKAGITETRFYRGLIARADRRFSAHLDRLRSYGGRH